VEKDDDKGESDKKTSTETGDLIEEKESDDGHEESNLMKCPACDAQIDSNKKFCTKCGTSLILNSDNKHLKKNNQDLNKNIESLKTSGEGLIKGLGGILDKTAASIDEKLAQQKSSPSNRDISERLKKIREQRDKPGYLVCDSCGGYYELQTGETPEDFSDECECGGKLDHYYDLPE
jgi:hypothetical protein